ncbi:MAG TPA: RodZ domain-containing protein, partial [Thermoanaerobaculia bacterium]|nr:RodZ domain-containing protein [Thermoanaerobaculia bacterium]
GTLPQPPRAPLGRRRRGGTDALGTARLRRRGLAVLVAPERSDGELPGDEDREAAAPEAGGTESVGSAAPAAPEWGAGGLREGSSFGTWLRRQREMREIDLREVAEKTKISLRYLKAMEQDRFEVLPAPIFARGFLREYAKYVGLNADEVVNYYLSIHEGEEPPEEPKRAMESMSMDSERSPITRGALLVFLLIVIVAALAYFLFYRESRQEARSAEPPPIAAPPVAEVPAEQVPAPTPQVPSAPLVVTVDFTEECWLEATIDGGEETINQLFVAGESLQLEAEQRVVFGTLGNARGVELQVNGMPFDLGPVPGNTARNVVIDLQTVERLRARAGR